ncbi:biopolymer transporter ExbD [Dokdonella sp.]|uniref:ExbD/TolR family protein n=1 Tax=Dokdonella sp. TaxID=2291710 RepID=UPI0025B7E403|nr:biopolymer transporter ExbD [Dokdonella sp.]MBX3693357.1 biopolymer transporter ExbD [Dokdonella sp.]MCW5567185.1 biopolymer transporter ExbD [Dokdonella sp.]
MRIAGRREEDFEINVIPLIDVLLTLLMFFVMTTTFVQHSAMKVTLPEASANAGNQDSRVLTILVDTEGRYFIDNNEVLSPSVETLKEALMRVAGDDRARQVVLRADAMTPHQAVVTAMDALGQLGFERLTIATTPAKAQGSR